MLHKGNYILSPFKIFCIVEIFQYCHNANYTNFPPKFSLISITKFFKVKDNSLYILITLIQFCVLYFSENNYIKIIILLLLSLLLL